MRILFFLAHPHEVGGADKVLLKQADIMQRQGNDVLVVIPEGEYGHNIFFDRICDDFSLTSVTCRYSVATCAENINIYDVDLYYKEIEELIRKFNPDIIHYNQLNITVEVASNQMKIPHLMSIYQVLDETYTLDWEPIFPHYICCDSKYYCDKWAKGTNAEGRVIRVPLDQPKIVPESREKGDIVSILNVGVVSKYKRQLEVIRFVEKCIIEGINVKLTLLGYCNGKYADECEHYVREHNLSKFVHFAGFVTNVEEYMQNADVLIQASSTESYPGAIVEAMSTGLPVISTPVGGIPELLKDEENGFLSEGCCNDEIYDAFKRYRESCNNGNIREIVCRAYETYELNHSYEAVGEKLTKLYSEVLSKYDFTNSYNLESYKILVDSLNLKYKETEICEYTKNHILYIWQIKKKLESRKFNEVFIWGAGNFGEKALEWVRWMDLDCKGFIDSQKKGAYYDFPIYAPSEQIIESAEAILIAIADSEIVQEISNRLKGYDKVLNEDYFFVVNNPCL